MLVYWLLRLRYLLLDVSLDTIPDIQVLFPDYHSTFTEIVNGIGYFIDLQAVGTLFTLWVSYMLLRIAMSFYHNRRR